jgi:hypothetical protein
LKEDFLLSKTGGSSPDVSTLSLAHEKNETASQTDLQGDVRTLVVCVWVFDEDAEEEEEYDDNIYKMMMMMMMMN